MNTPLRKTPAVRLALTCGLAFLPALHAQTAPAAPAAASSTAEDDTIMLSPFEVSTKKDVGYLAGNTLAGSRLNTSLKDTGAAISVLTTEFLKDIGATNMKDVIQFQNNAVPDVGDAALSVNGNPMIGNDEWQLRIRGLAASYSRNFFKWEASSDFYNVDRIDQSRGPNSILFGFGAPGGLVNTSTKQAKLYDVPSEVAFTVGSWERYRGSVDTNVVLVPNQLALRVNAVAENAKSWREFEFDNSRRAHLAVKYQPTKATSLRLEGEIGKVDDNVARPWLAIDQSFLWRAAGRPTKGIAGTGGDWNPPTGGAYTWDNHMIVGDDRVVRNWVNHAIGSNNADSNKSAAYIDIGKTDSWAAPTWSAWADTPANNALIPRTTNTGGPDAVRETKYKTFSAFFENKVNEDLTFELALNHQSTDFLGYDPDGSRATSYYGNSTEIWGDASSDLPDVWGNSAGANPTAGKLYVENNWTRRTQNIKTTDLRATVAYNFNTGDWAKHRAAGLLSYNERNFDRLEECEAFSNISGWPFNASAPAADVNRLYRRHYFTGGNAQDIRVQSWRVSIPGTRWVATQQPEDTKERLTTGMVALQSFFLNDKLVTIAGLRSDKMKYDYSFNGKKKTDFDASTLTAGAVYHATKSLSLFGNVASSRDLPNVRIHVIGHEIPPPSKSQGGDAGIKLDLLEGKLYATIGYYRADAEHMTDWGSVQTDITDRNTKILTALRTANLITVGDYNSRLIDVNGFMFDRESSGWEMTLVANPTTNWRISANFSINNVIARNSMAEVKKWADANVAYWLTKAAPQGGAAFLTGNSWDAWDNLGSQIGWMNQYAIDNIIALDGHNARGQRKYGGNLYTKYTFDNGALKGLSIGGGGRYQSSNVLGMYDDTLDGKYNPAVRYGRNLILCDASLGYSFKTEFMGKGSWTDIQLNVSNLMNERDPQIYTLTWWAKVGPGNTVTRPNERVGLQEPRKYSLSATVHF